MRIGQPGAWPAGDGLPTIIRLGIPDVDEDHSGLYLLAQELTLFPDDPISCRRCTRLMHAIWEGSFDHFKGEELLMQASGTPPPEWSRHAADHMRHLNYVTGLWTGDFDVAPPSAGQVARDLVGFWTKHIARFDAALVDRQPGDRRRR